MAPKKSSPAGMRKPEWVDGQGRPEIVVHPDIIGRPTAFRVNDEQPDDRDRPAPRRSSPNRR